MNNYLDMRALVPAVFFLIAACFSCTKPENPLGLDIQPEGDIINAQRITVPISTTTIGPRAIPSDEAVYNLAGKYNDPVFGEVSSSFSAQFRLNAVWAAIPPSELLLDSIVLSMKYIAVYNSSPSQPSAISLGVYELSQDIHKDSTYTTTSSTTIFPNKIGEKSGIIPQVSDSILNIKLDNSFGQKFLNSSNTDVLTKNEKFIQFFKGIQVKPEFTPAVNEGSIISFGRTASKITVYYKQNGTASQNSFIIDNNSATINHSNFDEIALANLQQNQKRAYLQGIGGVNAVVAIPDLKKHLPSGNVVINKASLIIPIDLSPLDFLPPNQITAVQYDSATQKILPIPDVLVGEAYFGGKYNASTKEYIINIGRYIQANSTNNNINNLFLLPANPAATPNRAILHGGSSEVNPMRLEIIFTQP